MKYLVIFIFALLALAYADPNPSGIIGVPAVAGLVAPGLAVPGAAVIAPGLVGPRVILG